MRAKDFKRYIIKESKKINAIIAFDELNDERIIRAIKRLYKEKICIPALIGHNLKQLCKTKGIDQRKVKLFEMTNDKKDELASLLFKIRREKMNDEAEAKKMIEDPIYFATMLVEKGDVDGLISGASHTTAHTIKPALQIIKARPPFKTISGAFFMLMPNIPDTHNSEKVFVFADCAIIPEPSSIQLAEIAIQSGITAKQFGISKPKVALLSFSTKGSADHPDVSKIKDATVEAKAFIRQVMKGSKLVKEISIDGELQADAAIVPDVAKRKVKMKSNVAGSANVLIFPDLNSGNISYKLIQRLAGAEAIGPVMQGLKKPVNDLSRGCSVDDVYLMAAVTSVQTQLKE